MFRTKLSRAVALLTILGSSGPSLAADSGLVSITTPRGARQSFILIKPKAPTAAVILFAGGHGALGLKSATAMNWGSRNFLVRTRERFAAKGLMVAVIDAPSDQRSRMNALFRMGRQHAGDISAVADHLKKHANVPVWLVGTSMGTFSAANGAIAGSGVGGLVLTSTVTRAKPEWKIKGSHRDGVASMPLGKVTVPTLIVSHRNDGCPITPASDAAKLKSRLTKARRVEVVLLSGGDPPISEPCQARSQHGFLGIEEQAVEAIAAFIRSNGS